MSELVSVITPAYNAEKCIAATIESVIHQTYQKWEMLVVNDYSKDSTQEIVEKYAAKDSRIILINAKKNGGVAMSRNLALKQAKGKYMAFVDADDLWLPQKLEKQIEFMREKGAAFSYTSYEMIDALGRRMNCFIQSKPTMNHKDVLKNTLIGCLTVMVDKEQTGAFRMPLIKHTEDNMTWHEILKRGFVAFGMPEILSQYRVLNTSMTSDKVNCAKFQWSTYRDYCKFGIAKSLYYFSWYAFNALTKKKYSNYRKE